MNPEQCNFPGLLRKLIAEYNMKPLLTRPQHTFHTDGRTYFEADIDVHLFGFIGRRGFAAARCAGWFWRCCFFPRYFIIYLFIYFVPPSPLLPTLSATRCAMRLWTPAL